MFAIIESGGKQYKVALGDKVALEKLPIPPGGKGLFDKVLLKSDEKGVAIGAPYIKGALVEADIIREGRARKKIVFRYHSKTRYRKKKGHRQTFSEVKITKI